MTNAAKTTTETASGTRISEIMAKTVIFRVEICKPSLVKKLTQAEKDLKLARGDNDAMDADNDHLRMSKELIDSDALRPVRALDSQYKTWLKYIKLPSPIVGGGAHLIPLAYVQELYDKTEEYKRQRGEAVEAFLEQYPALKAEQIRKDPELFKEKDYPSVETLREKFSVDHEFKTDEPPVTKLRALNDAQLRAELTKSQEKWKDVGNEITEALRAGLAELVSNAVSQLGSDDGKPRVFRDSLVQKINRFCETFAVRNDIVGDKELPAMVEELRRAMAGVTPENLRKDEAIRDTVKRAFDQVAQEMTEKNIIQRPRRVIRDDDEDDE